MGIKSTVMSGKFWWGAAAGAVFGSWFLGSLGAATGIQLRLPTFRSNG